MRRFFISFVLVLQTIGALVFCNAAEVKNSLAYAGESNGLYRYEFPDGNGFNCSMKNGDKDVALAFFSFQEGITWKMTRDNKYVTYKNGSILENDGNYVLVISSGDSYTDTFEFSVKVDENAIERELRSDGESLKVDLTPFLEGNVESNTDMNNLDNFNFDGYGVNENSLDVENFDPSDYVDDFDMTSFIEEQFKDIKTSTGAVETECVAYYNPATDRFIYKFPEGLSFNVSIPNGCITQESVNISVPTSMFAMLYKNGIAVPYSHENDFAEKGSYLIKIYSAEDAESSDYYFNFNFEIIGESVDDIEFVNAPVNFSINSVSFNGQNVAYNSSSYRADKDGDYIISFVNNSYPSKSYTISFTKDTVAPYVSLEKKGVVLSKVSYLPSENDALVEVFRNGESFENIGKLSKAGHYTLRISDTAGNSQDYYITISHPIVSFLLFLIILLAVLFGVYYLRTGAAKGNE